jgi:hypothetical protein
MLEREEHFFSLSVPRGWGRRRVMELLTKGLQAAGHDVTLRGDTGAAGTGPKLSLSADTLPELPTVICCGRGVTTG